MRLNGSSGRFAKFLTNEPRPKYVWNIFFGIIIACIVGAAVCFIHQYRSDHVSYDTEQIYITYKGNRLFTDVTCFEIPEEKKQDVKITTFIESVPNGEKIRLTVSEVSGEILEIQYQNRTVYRKTITPLAPTIVAAIVLVLPILALSVFLLVVFNSKNPKGKLRKIRDKYVK